MNCNKKINIVVIASSLSVFSFLFSILVSFKYVNYPLDYKLLALALMSWVVLVAFEAKYINYYTIIIISFLLVTSETVAMTPVDANKFYVEAFQGGYYSSGYLSTLVVTGEIFSWFSKLIETSAPEALVIVNYLIHCFCVALLVRANHKYKVNQVFVFAIFLSPLILHHLPFLLKDFFSVFFVVLSYFFHCTWCERGKKIWLFFAVFSVVFSMLFRVYAPFYLLMFFVVNNDYKRFHWPTIFVIILSMVIFFGKEMIYYFVYAFFAFYAVPNFLDINNFLSMPFITTEAILIFMLQVFFLVFALCNRKYEDINRYLKLIALIVAVYAFTSVFRVTYSSSYVPTGNIYLADNFFRKKIPILYVLWLFLSTISPYNKMRFK
ncbi:hypothetical protein AB4581_15245 [Vibrio cyclitrophicus]|uniref:hypothetical protein n=2 Tax=Vibrio TaxID=662 RepID=UPI0011B780B1|nr:hypothetical protein [Vibrio cyclitrophicus]